MLNLVIYLVSTGFLCLLIIMTLANVTQDCLKIFKQRLFQPHVRKRERFKSSRSILSLYDDVFVIHAAKIPVAYLFKKCICNDVRIVPICFVNNCSFVLFVLFWNKEQLIRPLEQNKTNNFQKNSGQEQLEQNNIILHGTSWN